MMTNQKFSLQFWVRFSLLNLVLVALLGTLMRYKIAFSLPWIDQKNLLHAHSHFAFAGWVSLALSAAMIATLPPEISGKSFYKWLLGLTNLTAYGMLLSFAVQGYGAVSIPFATLSVVLGFVFAGRFARDLRAAPPSPARPWFYAALLFLVVSAGGTASLVQMMASGHMDQHRYLASLYWYLHFQYNGWFLFGCIGLLVGYLHQKISGFQLPRGIFWAFAGAAIPAYGLSVLWAHLPVIIYGIIVMAAITQTSAWIWLLRRIYKPVAQLTSTDVMARNLMIYVAAAFSIKTTLQLFSVIPQMSKLAFGFRPVVIAYLHLSLLAVTSVFLVGYFYLKGCTKQSRWTIQMIVLFLVAVFLNELVLGVQGVASFMYFPVPYVNEMLLIVAALLFVSAAGIFIGSKGEQIMQDDF